MNDILFYYNCNNNLILVSLGSSSMSENKLDIYTVHTYKRLTRVRPALPTELLESLHKAGVDTCKVYIYFILILFIHTRIHVVLEMTKFILELMYVIGG